MKPSTPTTTTTRVDFRTRIAQGALVLDGAMGTLLNERGIAFNECFEMANLERREWVEDIHRRFLDAGSEGVHTNTFGANLYRLARHHLEGRLEELVESGVEIARNAAGPERYVIAALGPTGIEIEPIGRVAREEVRAAYRQVVKALQLGVIDAISLETFSNLDELVEAALAVRDLTDLPLLAQLTVDARGVTLYGTHPEEACRRLELAGADVVGINCSTGPRAVLKAASHLIEATDLPVSARPNAGIPRQMDGRIFYEHNPDYFGRFARRFLQGGGAALGGCCGTTPDHIRAMVSSARAVGAQQRGDRSGVKVVPRDQRPLKPPALEQRSRFGAKLAGGSFPVSVELLPPRSPDASALIEAAAALRDVGADAINLPDGPRASARISNIPAAYRIEQEAGIETLVHFCCRDRNLLGMQSDLMGAAALNLRNFLVITGDPPYQGNYPDMTAVFDVDAIGLCNILDQLNHGLDVGGNNYGGQTGFCYGAALNHTAVDLERELTRFEWKIKAGIDFAITQPIFDVDGFLRVLDRLPADAPPILAGVWPLRSLRNAEFLASEVPGVVVPDAVLQRMAKADRSGAAADEGVTLARETILALRGRVAGLQIAAPFNKVEPVIALMQTVEELR